MASFSSISLSMKTRRRDIVRNNSVTCEKLMMLTDEVCVPELLPSRLLRASGETPHECPSNGGRVLHSLCNHLFQHALKPSLSAPPEALRTLTSRRRCPSSYSDETYHEGTGTTTVQSSLDHKALGCIAPCYTSERRSTGTGVDHQLVGRDRTRSNAARLTSICRSIDYQQFRKRRQFH